ncbi:MAG: hypothetical protein ABIQ35_12270 [Verrucomicrobiota bacterium]
MLKTSYKHLNNIQKGSIAEAYAKMAFTLEGFEVYTSEYDDRGIDFVIRNNKGSFFSVQVKSTGPSVSPFIYAKNFEASPDFLLCAVRLIEGSTPEIYLTCGTDWNEGKECLNFNQNGGNAGAYYELRFSKVYLESLKRHKFENYVLELKVSPSVLSRT